MKLAVLLLTVSVVSGCAAVEEKNIPESWTEASVEDIHDHYYSVCARVYRMASEQSGRPIDDYCKRGAGNPFKRDLEPGFRIYRYRSAEEHWKNFSGNEGFVLVVNGQVVDEIMTTIQ